MISISDTVFVANSLEMKVNSPVDLSSFYGRFPKCYFGQQHPGEYLGIFLQDVNVVIIGKAKLSSGGLISVGG